MTIVLVRASLLPLQGRDPRRVVCPEHTARLVHQMNWTFAARHLPFAVENSLPQSSLSWDFASCTGSGQTLKIGRRNQESAVWTVTTCTIPSSPEWTSVILPMAHLVVGRSSSFSSTRVLTFRLEDSPRHFPSWRWCKYSCFHRCQKSSRSRFIDSRCFTRLLHGVPLLPTGSHTATRLSPRKCPAVIGTRSFASSLIAYSSLYNRSHRPRVPMNRRKALMNATADKHRRTWPRWLGRSVDLFAVQLSPPWPSYSIVCT